MIEKHAHPDEKNQAGKRQTEVQPTEKELATPVREHSESKKQEPDRNRHSTIAAERIQGFLNLWVS